MKEGQDEGAGDLGRIRTEGGGVCATKLFPTEITGVTMYYCVLPIELHNVKSRYS